MPTIFHSRNAGAINDVCRDQGMSGAQCTLFTRAFQLIDRFMSTVEEKEEEAAEERARSLVAQQQQQQLGTDRGNAAANSARISSEEQRIGREDDAMMWE